MLECKEVRPLLAEYEAGSLPEEQAAQVADHLLLCPICAAALEDLRRAQERAAMSQVDALFSAAPRSLGTPDPLAAEKAAPAPEADEPAPAAEDAPVPMPVTEAAPHRKLPRWGKVLLALGALVLIAALAVAALYTPKPVNDPVDPDFGLPPAGNGQIQPRTAGVADALSLCADAQGVA